MVLGDIMRFEGFESALAHGWIPSASRDDVNHDNQSIPNGGQRHNQERPHSSLDYQTPVEFAQRSLAAALFPQNTNPTKLNPKTTKNSHSEWIKNRG